MRKTLYALVFVLALSGSALAGDINNPPVAAPGDMSCPPLAAGDMGCPPSATQSPDDSTTGGLTEGVLNVLNSVLALL